MQGEIEIGGGKVETFCRGRYFISVTSLFSSFVVLPCPSLLYAVAYISFAPVYCANSLI